MLINFQNKLDINYINNSKKEPKLNIKISGLNFDIAKDLKLFKKQSIFNIETRMIDKFFMLN